MLYTDGVLARGLGSKINPLLKTCPVKGRSWQEGTGARRLSLGSAVFSGADEEVRGRQGHSSEVSLPEKAAAGSKTGAWPPPLACWIGCPASRPAPISLRFQKPAVSSQGHARVGEAGRNVCALISFISGNSGTVLTPNVHAPAPQTHPPGPIRAVHPPRLPPPAPPCRPVTVHHPWELPLVLVHPDSSPS